MLLRRKTKRLVVRPLAAADYLAWKNAYTQMLPRQNKWDRQPRKPEETTRSKFQIVLSTQKKMRKADHFYDLAVFEIATGALVGSVSLMNVQRSLGQTAFLGYQIFNRHWGKGYGKEAVSAIIDIAFRDLLLHRIEAGVEPTNRRSILLARSLGLRKEGLKKRAVFLRDRWNDLVMYSATCEEFGFRWKGKLQARIR